MKTEKVTGQLNRCQHCEKVFRTCYITTSGDSLFEGKVQAPYEFISCEKCLSVTTEFIKERAAQNALNWFIQFLCSPYILCASGQSEIFPIEISLARKLAKEAKRIGDKWKPYYPEEKYYSPMDDPRGFVPFTPDYLPDIHISSSTGDEEKYKNWLPVIELTETILRASEEAFYKKKALENLHEMVINYTPLDISKWVKAQPRIYKRELLPILLGVTYLTDNDYQYWIDYISEFESEDAEEYLSKWMSIMTNSRTLNEQITEESTFYHIQFRDGSRLKLTITNKRD